MDQPRYVKKKLVTVRCKNPFSYRKIPFAGICNKVVLEVEAINYALMNKALVVEHLKGNKEISLGFDNYNTWNGPTMIDDDSEVFKFTEPEIEMIDGLGNRTVKNKHNKASNIQATIKHINLDELKAQKEEEEKKQKEIEIQRKKQEELEKREAELKAQKERDKKAREEAAAKILAEAQAKAENSKKEDSNNKEEYSFDFPVSLSTVEPKSDFTNSSQQENKKTNYDGGKKDKRK